MLRGARLVLLFGPPGTGKTTAAVNAARALGQSVYNVTLTDETPAAELRGHWIPAEDGRFKWHDGPAMRAFREGATLVLNEVDHASADALDFLHTLCDDPGIAAVTLPTGETVFPHEDFRVVATTNSDPDVVFAEDGPRAALGSRFAVKVFCGETHPDAIAALPDDLRLAAAGLDPAMQCRADIRSWVTFAALRSNLGEETAALAVFRHRASDVLDALKLAGAR